MFSLILFEGLKFNLFISGIIYESLVLGFLPIRIGVFLKLKEPKPLNLTDLDKALLLINSKKDSNNIDPSKNGSEDFLVKFFIILFLLKFIYLSKFLVWLHHQF